MTQIDSSKDRNDGLSDFFLDGASYAMDDAIGTKLADFFDAHRAGESARIGSFPSAASFAPSAPLPQKGALTATYNALKDQSPAPAAEAQAQRNPSARGYKR